MGFLGPNGAGKTTTVRMLAALVAPTSGNATVAGYRLGDDNDAIRGCVGILTESPGLYGSLTARANLRFFGRLHGIDDSDIDSRIDRYMKMLDLDSRADERAADYSKGMRQKLAIARALLHDPPIIFLDEPTSALDPESAHTVRAFIRALRDEGRTILLATHNLAEADELCDSIALFRTHLLRVDTPTRLREAFGGDMVRMRFATSAHPFLTLVRNSAGVSSATVDGATLTLTVDDVERDMPRIVRGVVESGAELVAVEPHAASLEEAYLRMMAEHDAEASS